MQIGIHLIFQGCLSREFIDLIIDLAPYHNRNPCFRIAGDIEGFLTGKKHPGGVQRLSIDKSGNILKRARRPGCGRNGNIPVGNGAVSGKLAHPGLLVSR